MADPLSVAGVVFGVVSLGLQVADGLSKYLDGVRGRTEELNWTKQQGEELKNILLTIKDLIPQIERNSPGSAPLIERHVKSCDTELSALYTLVCKLSQSATTSTGIQRLATEHARKLTYPFNRSHIVRLEKRLDRVNGTLQLALQVTTIHICVTTANQMQSWIHSSDNRISQVHDVVLSMSSLQTQNTSLTAVRAVPRVAANMGHVGSLDSVNIATSSTVDWRSRPLESIGWLQDCNTLSQTHNILSQSCSCTYPLIRSYHQRIWDRFFFSYENSNTRRHRGDCPISEITCTQATRLMMKYKGRRTLLQIECTLSHFTSHYGGRISISSRLSYCPVVDQRKAPAFRILILTAVFVWNSVDSDDATRHKDIIKTVQYCFKSILTLYSQNRAALKGVDSSGRSLMHWVVNFSYYLSPYPGTFTDDLLSSFMANLATCGVLPGTAYDAQELTSSARLMDILSLNYSGDGLMNCFLLPDPNIPPFIFNKCLRYNVSLFWLLYNIKLAEASACGPLSLAAVAGNEGVVKDLLQQDPQAITEINQFGHTPVHLSINQPSCLRLILEAGGSKMRDMVDFAGYAPLDYASQFEYHASTQILLASGSCIRYFSIELGRGSCIDLLFTTLRQRREELKVLALDNLTEADAMSVNLQEDTVLDDNASQVRGLLLKRHIHVPLWMSASEHWSAACHDISKLDYLWSLGFRDVDSCRPSTRTPLLTSPGITNKRWLIEHGADYWTPYKKGEDRTMLNAPITGAHFVLGQMGINLLLNYRRAYIESEAEIEAYQWTFEKLVQVHSSDDCFSCFCFLGGCTPFKAFWDGFTRFGTNLLPQDFARGWLKCIRMLQNKLSKEHSVAALRRITFDALNLPHTCCEIGISTRKSVLAQEEIDEIHREQDSLLSLFSNLLTELNLVALEDRGGKPFIISDPEEFWLHRWLPRMEETLHSLDGDKITDEERSAGEVLGVVWGPPRAEVLKPEYVMKTLTPEYVMKEVAKIMNE